jgi:hypothetical protein
MAKPIVIIKVDDHVQKGGVNISASELMDMFGKMMPDYHVLSFPAPIDDIFEVQVFYEKDFTEIQYAELKELITKQINEINHGKDNFH